MMKETAATTGSDEQWQGDYPDSLEMVDYKDEMDGDDDDCMVDVNIDEEGETNPLFHQPVVLRRRGRGTVAWIVGGVVIVAVTALFAMVAMVGPSDGDRRTASSSYLPAPPSLSESDVGGDEVHHEQEGHQQQQQKQPQTEMSDLEARVTEKLRPRYLIPSRDSVTGDPTFQPKQFVHLHHMKTGGTSMNQVLSCARSRLERRTSTQVPFYSISECSWSSYHKCISGGDEHCMERADEASIMQYCAPLYQASQFGWLDADILTVIRNPVDRVWSMFRFQTRGCYKCHSLLDVYHAIDDGTINDLICDGKDCHSVCIPQILDHQVRNLLTSGLDEDVTFMSDEDKLNEAIYNLENRFAVVGITEEIVTTRAMVGHAFPWMNETWVEEGVWGGEAVGDGHDETCPLPHANASPRNNHCGDDGGHWDLPDEPDEETRQAIMAHNRLDMELYERAKAYFAVEKRVLGWD